MSWRWAVVSWVSVSGLTPPFCVFQRASVPACQRASVPAFSATSWLAVWCQERDKCSVFCFIGRFSFPVLFELDVLRLCCSGVGSLDEVVKATFHTEAYLRLRMGVARK